MRGPRTLLLALTALLAADGAFALSCATTKVVKSGGGADCTTIQQCVNGVPAGALSGDYCIDIQDSSTYTEQVTIQGKSPNGHQIAIGAISTANNPAINPPAASTAAFQVLNASVTLVNMTVRPTNLVPYGVWASSAYVTISTVNVDAPGGAVYAAGVYLSSACSLSRSSITVGGAYGIYSDGRNSTVFYSTAQASGSFYALFLNGASGMTIGGLAALNPSGPAVSLSGASYNTITQSSMTGNSASAAVSLNASSTDTISQSSLANLGSGAVLQVTTGSSYDYLVGDTVAGAANSGPAVSIAGSPYVTISQTSISNSLHAAAGFQSGSDFGSVITSTMTSSTSNLAVGALYVIQSASPTVANCYVQGSTAVVISGSTGAVVTGSWLLDNNPGGSGIMLTGGSRGLILSSNTIWGGASGAGVYLDRGGSGLIVLSTNTVESGAQYGVLADTQAPGTQVFITSNTVFPMIAASYPTYGLYLNGLTSGATIQNNGVYYRTPGGTTQTTYGLYAQSAAGLSINHNRISMPGLLTSGSYQAVALVGDTATTFKFNDVHSTGTAFTNAYLLSLTNGSTGAVVKDNIFSASMTVTGSSATVSVSADSQANYSADFNDFFSSNSLNTGLWGASSYQLLSTWQSATSQDPNSKTGNPLWQSPVAFIEDFHPKSVKGRWDPSLRMWVADAVSSLTIDRGDNGEDYSSELQPNGARVNQGSYGDTAEASLGALTMPVGCDFGYNVKQDGSWDYTTIQAAVNALPTNASGSECVVIKDTQTYLEQVTVGGITSNGYAIQIMVDPSMSSGPVVSPPANSTAAFLLQDRGVSLLGLSVIPANAVTYGVWASSDYVTISSVNVVDVSGKIGTAGVAISSYSLVSYSSVVVQNTQALYVPGTQDSVLFSTFVNSANTSNFGALTLDGGSSSTVSNCYISNPLGLALLFKNDGYDNVQRSSITSNAANLAPVSFKGSNDTLLLDYISDASGPAVVFTQGVGGILIAQSTMAANSARAAVSMKVNSTTTITQSYVYNPSGFGVQVASSILVGLWNSYLIGSQSLWITGSTNTTVDGNVMIATNAAGNALWLAGGSVNLSASSNTLSGGPQGAGILIDSLDQGLIVLSTNTVLPGAEWGISVATQAAGALVYITSNTVVPTLLSANAANTYGIYLNGQGATVEYNGVYYRTSGSMAGHTTYGLYAQSASGLVIDHNRFSMPGLLTSGGYEAVGLYGDANAVFKFNDVFSTGTGLTSACLLHLSNGSTGATVKDNIFMASMTVTGSSATINMTADSASGFSSDYNDFFSSNSANSALVGTVSYGLLAAWQGATGGDSNSLALNPLFYSPGAGVEDFHPKSTNGRWDPVSQSVALDGADSPTIDKADPAEGFALEPAPNGYRANQGSFGGTGEASMSPPSIYPGCASGLRVKQDGTMDYTTIQAAVLALPANLTGNECVVIKDTQTYVEQVTVQGFATNGYQLEIVSDASFTSSAPVVAPPAASTAAFQVLNTSVTLTHITVLGANPMPYGVKASSPNVTVSSFSVQDTGNILTAGVALSSYSVLLLSSVTVQAAHGVYLDGAGDTVYYSSAQASGSARYAFYLLGGSGSRLGGSYGVNAAGPALVVSGASNELVAGCTLSGSTAAWVFGSTGTTVTSSVLVGTNTAGSGLWLSGGSGGLTMTNDWFVGGTAGAGVRLDVNNQGNLILSTNTAAAGAEYGVFVATQQAGTGVFVTSNTVLPAPAPNGPTYGLYFEGLAAGATVENNSVVYRTPAGGSGTTYGLYAKSSAGLLIDHNRILNPGMVTSGGVEAVALVNATATTFKFNDVLSTGTGLASAYLLHLTNGSTGAVVKDNIFAASMTVTGSSATLSVSADSQGGFASDYNDFYSSNSLDSGIWGGTSYQFPAGWSAGTGKDGNSLAVNPLWQVMGVEDTHPRSTKGRWNPNTASFNNDMATSLTIDKADPAEPYNLEPSPNGSRANLGSYGDTAQASGSAGILIAGCASGYNVKQDGSMDFTSIQAAVNALSPSLLANECVIVRDTQTYHEQVTVQGFVNNGFQLEIVSDPAFVSSAPVVSPPSGSTAAFQVINASVTLTHFIVRGNQTMPYGVASSSAYVTISSMSVDGNSKIATAGIWLSSYSALSYSSVTVQSAHGLYLDGAGDLVSYSTATSASSSFFGLYANGGSFSTFTVITASNTAGTAASFASGAAYNTVNQANFLTNAAAGFGLSLLGASTNTFVLAAITNTAGEALKIASGGGYNAVAQSTITSPGAGVAVEIGQTTAGNQVSSSKITGQAWINTGAQGSVLGLDAITATTVGIVLDAASSSTIVGCTVQGSTAVWVRGSTGTVVGASTLSPSLSNGSGLALSGNSSGLVLSSSVVTGGSGSYAVNLEPNNQGTIILSTNTILSGAPIGIRVATQTAGAAIYITSNTILPTLGLGNSYGLYFNGLTSGATVEYNGIFYRTIGSMSGFTAYGLYLLSSPGVVVDHNQISMPNMLTAGSFEGVSAYGSPGLSFKFNDVHSTGTTLTNAFLLRLYNSSTGALIKNNIFSSSMAVSGSSASIIASADSQTGFASDYNDWFSSNSLDTGIWGGTSYQFQAGWNAGTGNDANSLTGNPLWFSPGAEDFHPKSTNGRWDPVNRFFVNDGANSPTIDRADPFESFGGEPSPNGGRANIGSTGNTAEASKSPQSLASGCGSGFNVKQDGTMDYTTITGALNALATNMGGVECVIIRDTQTYHEQVTVQGFTNHGYQLQIMADPSFISSAPVVSPPAGSTAAFQVANASVTLYHITVAPSVSVNYGVWASSAYVTLSTISVDSGGRIWGAGVAISSWDVVSGSSITVQGAHGLMITGSTNTITLSTMSASVNGRAGLYIGGTSSNTITQSYILNTTGSGAYLDAGSQLNTISQSTVTSAVAAGGIGAIYFNSASSNTVRQCAINNTPGYAVDMLYSNNNTITQSTITSNGGGYYALYLTGSSSNTITFCTISNQSASGGYGAFLSVTSNSNYIGQSVMTGGLNTYGLDITASSSNTITQCSIGSPTGYGAFIDRFAGYNTISQSTITAQGANDYGLYVFGFNNLFTGDYMQGTSAVRLSGSTGTVIAGSVLVATGTTGNGLLLDQGSGALSVGSSVLYGGPHGAGVYLDKTNQGIIILSTNVIPSGAQYGIYAATQAATAQIFVTSNTILPTLGTGVNTYGLYINGLTSGATIENNAIAYRSPGSMGALATYGLYAQSASGLMIDRNRFSNPGMVTGGSFFAAAFAGSTASTFKYNDVLSTGTSLTNAFLLQFANASTGGVVKDNILLSSVSVTASSATLSVSADSQGSFASDYNDWFSSNSASTGLWGASSYQFPAAWRAASSQDANSIAANPLWQVTGPEDFHPRSMRGRYDPTTASFTPDAATSQTVDGGDPGDAFAAEPAPNGSRANQGSYGNTAQASESAAPPTNPIVASVVSSSITVSWGAVSDDGYQVDVSTKSDFSSGVISSATTNAAVTQLAPQGLVPNTTYFLRAAALYTPFSNYGAVSPASTVTLAAPPATPVGVGTFTAVTANALTLNWSSGTAAAGYDPVGTLYIAQISTMSNFNPVASSSLTFNLSASFSGLTAGLVYFAEVQAANVSGGSTTFTNFGSTATAAPQPGLASPTFSAMLTNGLTVNWSPNGNGAGTTYYAQISTMATFAPIMFSSTTYNLFAGFSSLNPNTTYFLQAAAYNLNTSTWTPFTNLGSTSTLAAAPSGTALNTVNVSSAGLSWSANGDPLGTLYLAQVSTDNFLTVSASSRTLNPSTTFFALASNDTYYLQVEAINNNGVATGFGATFSTWTLAAAPASSPTSSVGLSSATANWDANGNAAGTIFVVQVSTNNFATFNASSQTLNASALFGAGGIGASLSPNTTYWFQAKSIANGGLSTAFTALPSTMTLAADPAPAVATFTAVSGNSLTLNWSSGTLATGYNGPATLYIAQVSTMASFNPLAGSSQTLNTFATITGLNPNFTYFAQVQALNGGGWATIFVNFGSTATPTAQPGAPGSSTFTAITANSFTANWSANGNPTGTTYYAQISTMPTFVPIVFSSTTYNLFASYAGLGVNTTYYAHAAAYSLNTSTWTAFTDLTSTSTLANTPASAVLSQVFQSSVSMTWSPNGNPNGTTFLAQISNDNFATVAFTSRTLSSSATFFALASNGTYYLQVLALNNAGAATAAAAPPSTWTAVSAPVSAQPSAVGTTQVTVNWTTSDAAGTNYVVQMSTDNFLTLDASSQTFNASVTFSGLLSNATYFFKAKAIANSGQSTAFTALPSTWTAIAQPTAALPTTVGVSSVTANWGANGDAIGTIYIAQISTDNFATLNASSQTLNAAVLFSGLQPDSTIYAQVQVLGYDGRSTAFTALATTMTLAADPAPAIATFTAVGGNGLTLNWSSGTAAAGYNTDQTLYVAQISTMASFNPLASSSQTFNTSVAYAGLNPNQTYFARVQAVNGLGLSTAFINFGSTSTPTAQPGTAATTFTAITTGGLTVDWTSNGNQAGTTYYAQVSTMATLVPIAFSSTTYNLFAGFAGLNANTTYYAQAAAYNLNTSTWTAFTNLSATSTLANAPLSPVLAEVDFSSVSVSWGANGDPSWTTYQAQVSTDNFATVNASSLTLNTSVFFTGLLSNATYYTKVRALSNTGAATVFVAAPTTWTVVSAPVSAQPSAIGTTQVTANWTTADAAGTNYVVQLSTDNFLTLNASSQTFNAAVLFSGLVSNATYYFQAKAIANNGQSTAFTALPSTWTAIALPTASNPTTVGISSVTANWGANGDALGTIYIAQISTDNFTTVNASSRTLNVSALFQGLGPNTSYYTQVQVLSYAGAPTSFIALPSTMTLAADPAPAVATFTAVTATGLTLNWSSGTLATGYNPVPTSYLARISTDGFATVVATSQTLNTSATFSALSPNFTYAAQVRALNGLGMPTMFVSFGSTATVTQPPATVAVPFTAIGAGGLTANWGANGNPAGTTYYAQISTMATFVPVAFSSTTYNLFAGFAGLNANTTYYAQAAAYSLNSATWTAFTNLTATSTLANAPLSPALAEVDFSSVSVSWGANGDPSWTTYQAQVSTDNFATVNASSLTLNTSVFFTGLLSNATYYTKVRALSNTGAATAFNAAPTTWTVVSAPVSAQPSAIGTTQITANWTTADAAGTNYVVQLSTDNFLTLNASSQTFNAAVLFSGLVSNATYYFQAKAIANNGQSTAFTALPSTWTAIALPAAASPTTVGLSSVTENWGSNGDVLGTVYAVQLSTDNFLTLNASSTTLNNSAPFAGLGPNTSYFAQVQVIGYSGQATAFTALPSTMSLAADPAPAVATFTAVAPSALTLNWSSGTVATGYNPVPTSYLARISTDGFATVVATSQTLNTSATFSALSPNFTYAAQVQALNGRGVPTAFVNFGSTSTPTAQPGVPATVFTAVTASGLTVNWTANGNLAGTTYYAQISTMATFSPILMSSQTYSVFASFAGLSVNTTYYAQAASYNLNTSTWTAFTNLSATSTLANAPLSPALAEVDFSSVSVSWGANGDPSWTTYQAQVSTDNFATVNASSLTLNTSVFFTGLLSNATYYTKVRALSNTGAATAFVAAPTTWTVVSAPVSAQPSAIGTTQIKANWATADASGTNYLVQLSTDNFLTLNASSQTFNAAVLFSGLVSNATYYFQAKAIANNGQSTAFTALPSTWTAIALPAAASPTTVGLSSATENWGSNGDVLGTVYAVQLSTDGFATLNASSVTLNTSALFTGLNPNTSYYGQVQVLSYAGIPTAFTALPSTMSLAADPGPAVATFTAVGGNGLTLNWSSGTAASGYNTAQTLYSAQISTMASFNPLFSSSSTFNTSASFSGLTPNLSYFARVQAINGRGLSTAFVNFGSTSTPTAPPGAPATVFTAITAGGLTVNWTSSGNQPGTTYYAQISTMASFNPIAFSSTTYNLFASFAGLAVNTSYYAQAAAYDLNSATWTVFTNLTATSTLANAPLSPALAEVDFSSVSVSWGANGDPAWTTYQAQVSTDNFATVNASSLTLNTSAFFTGLISNATYYTKVRALSNTGAATAFNAAPTTWTVVSAPVSAQPSAIGTTQITANWTTSDAAGTNYVVQLSTNNFLTLNASSQTFNTSVVFSGLLSNATYYFQTKAIANNGQSTSFTALPSTWTAIALPAAASPTTVGLSSVTENWGANGDVSGTIYVVQISTDNFSTLSASSTTLNASAVFSALAPGTSYYAQVQVLGYSGQATAFTALPSTMTLAADPGPAVATFTAVGGNALTLNWSSGTAASGYNSAGTLYLAQISTMASFNPPFSSSSTYDTSVAFSGLNPNSSYFARVKAFNAAGAATAFVNFGSTATPTAQPGAASPTFSAILSASLSVSWTSNGNQTGTTYYAQISTSAGFSPVFMSSLTYSLSASFAGLSVNTTYYAQAAAYNLNTTTWTVFANLGSTSTLAKAPILATLNEVDLTSAAFSWGANSNPAWTLYNAEISTDNFASVAFTSRTLSASATFFGLVSNATYYLQVQALNNNGAATAFNSAGSTLTQAALPLPAAPTNVGASNVTANWLSDGNAPTTVYVAKISTDGFVTVNASSVTLNTSAVFQGLNSNTAYDFEVQVLSYGGAGGPFVALPSTTTLLLPPGAAANPFSGVGLSSMTAAWTSGGNGVGTSYVAQVSTDGFATLNLSSTTFNMSLLAGTGGAGPALSPNTTYYARVQAANGPNNSAFFSIGSTMTFAADPGPASATFTAVTGNGLTLNWSSGTAASGYNPAQTIYLAQISTMASFNPLFSSSQTYNTSAAFSALNPNSPYFARVKAVNGGGTPTAFVSFGSTATPVAAPGPASPVFSAISAGALTVNWTSNGNLPGTTYYAQISTMPTFAPVAFASSTYNLFAAFAGLSANTAYYAQAAAYDMNAATWTSFANLGSTSTLANPPAAPALAQVNASSISVSWGTNGDPLGTRFEGQASADNFATVAASSVTLNSSVFFTGLLSNATYYTRVRALNNAGAATAFVAGPTTWTVVAAPVSASPSGVNTTQATANWTSNDAAGTNFVAQISTDNFLTVNSSSQTFNASASFTGLLSNTLYYFRVKAIGGDGGSTAYTVLPSTMTLLLAPGAAAQTFTAVGVSSVAVAFTSGGNGAGTIYAVQLSTDDFATLNASSNTLNLSALFGTGGTGPSLAANTTFYARVQAVSGPDQSAFAMLGSTFTLANAPSGTAASGIWITSASLTWGLNSNPAGTPAEVQRSTDGVSYAFDALVAATTLSDASLQECSTYWFRVRDRNFAGIPTGFDAPVSFVTQGSTPSAAGGLAAAPLAGNKIALSWNASPSAGAAFYDLYYDAGAGAVNYGAPLAVVAAPATSFTTGVLASSATYRFALRVRSRCGIEETNTTVMAASASTTTLSAVSAAVANPISGTRATGDRVTLYANLTAGTAAQTSKVLFQYKPSSAAVWADVPAAELAHPNPAMAPPYFIHWDLTAVPATNYDLRTMAYDLSGATDTALTSITIADDPANWTIHEYSLGGGMIQRDQIVSNSVSNTITAADGASSLVANIVLPAGSLTASTATISVIPNPAPPGPAPSGLGAPNMGVSIAFSNGQSVLNGQLGTLSFSYADADGDGIVDGTGVPASQLKFFSWNAAAGQWQQDAATTVDTVNHTVSGLAPHFSFWSVFGVAPAANLGNVRVYPNPYRPGGSNPDEGRPFNPGDPNSGIIFDNLPADFHLAIYTISGSLVAHFDGGTGAGKVQWDAKNDVGRDVASGVYFAVITSQGTQTVTKKIAIIR